MTVSEISNATGKNIATIRDRIHALFPGLVTRKGQRIKLSDEDSFTLFKSYSVPFDLSIIAKPSGNTQEPSGNTQVVQKNLVVAGETRGAEITGWRAYWSQTVELAKFYRECDPEMSANHALNSARKRLREENNDKLD